MGEKAMEFDTKLTVRECGQRFQSGIVGGRGLSSRIGGLYAKALGGEALTFYTPEDNSPFAELEDDRPAFAVGVAVPRAQGAHANGTNLHMYVWERGSHREVAVLAHHSLAGGPHARQLMDAVRSQFDR
jgi:hypothetical protein